MAAVAGASPVTITVRTPNPRNSVTSAAESERGGSLSAMRPASFIAVGGPAPTASTLKPCLELLRRFCSGRRRVCEADDRGKGALNDTLCCAGRISCGRLGQLLRRIERHEFDQLKCIGNRLACSGGANRAIDRILPTFRTSQRGQR